MPRRQDYLVYHKREVALLPPLYHVQLPNSATTYDPSSGLAAIGALPDDPRWTTVRSIRPALTEHLNWQSEIASPFISVFDDEDHARNWALAWSMAHNDEECTIYEIAPGSLHGECWVFEADELIQELDLVVPAHVNVEGEYLVLHNIPMEAVRGEWEVSATEESDSDSGMEDDISGEDEDEEGSEEEGSEEDDEDGGVVNVNTYVYGQVIVNVNTYVYGQETADGPGPGYAYGQLNLSRQGTVYGQGYGYGQRVAFGQETANGPELVCGQNYANGQGQRNVNGQEHGYVYGYGDGL